MNKITLADIWKKLAPPDKNNYLGWRIASILTAGLITLALMLTAFFVYNNIYNTLANACSIINLNSELGMDIVDMDNFYKTAGIIDAKKKLTPIPPTVRNIFTYYSTPSSTTKI